LLIHNRLVNSPYTAALSSLSELRRSVKSVANHTDHSFVGAATDLLRHPQNVLFLWNWKAALLSLVLRGPIFLVATIRRGWQAAIAALLTESIFCVLSAGFYGAVVQSLRDAQPLWLTLLFLTLVMPASFQILEFELHRMRGTPHLIPAEIVSLIVSGFSALFNWYAMRRGTLLVGGEGKAFGKDVKSLPALILGFIAVLPSTIAGRLRDWRRQ
jgi:hypothetical protein